MEERSLIQRKKRKKFKSEFKPVLRLIEGEIVQDASKVQSSKTSELN